MSLMSQSHEHVGPAIGVITSISGTALSLMLTNYILPIVQLIALVISISAGVVSIIWYVKQIRAWDKKNKD